MDAEPFRGSAAVARGLVTPGALRGPRYRRLLPDIHVDAQVPDTPLLRARAAALLAEGSGGAAAAYSAAELHGASCGPWHAPAEIVAPERLRARPGLVPHRGPATGFGLADGAVVTSPQRTAWDLVRRSDPIEAVVALDALAARDRKRPTFVPLAPGVPVSPQLREMSRLRTASPGFDPAELLAWRDAYPRARGAGGLDRIVALADPRAESPPETRLRLLLVGSGLPAPQVQFGLFDGGRYPWARFDLAYPEALLAIEYDGGEHDDRLDRARDLRTSALGWQTLRVTAEGLYRTPQRTAATIRDLRDRRAHLLHR